MESFISKHYTSLFVGFLAIFGCLAFYAGYLHANTPSGGGNGAVMFSCSEAVLSKLSIPTTTLAQSIKYTKNNINNTLSTDRQGEWVGSKNGTKYYTPGCAGASRIKTENYVWFESEDDATVQGYSRGSC